MSTNTQVIQAAESSINPFDLLFNDSAFERLEKVAALMASGRSTIPQHLRGSPGDCFAIVMQAARWHVDPYAVAQKTFLINGVMGYEAQLVSAIINKNAPITGRLQYEWFGPWEKIIGKFETRESKTKKDDNGYAKKYKVPAWKPQDEDGLGVRVSATMKGETEPRVLELYLSQALTRNSTLWAEDPKQQLAYLASKRWSRLYCSDVLMGVYTPDELEEIDEKIINEVPRNSAGEPVDGKTEEVLNGLNKKPKKTDKKPPIEGQAEPLPNLSDILSAISKIDSQEANDAAKAMIGKLEGPDRETAITAHKAKVAELKAKAEQKNKPEKKIVDWESAIDECTNIDELNALKAKMPEDMLEATEVYREKKVMSFPEQGDAEFDNFNME